MSAIRDTILNNYLETYGAPKVSRYDSHKKSELRSTYNSIVKLNKEAPWYLPVTSKETQNFAIGLKESARELRTNLAELGGLEPEGIFDKKHASSSNEYIASASYIGEGDAAETAPSFTLEVKTLASGQINTGRYLSDREVGLPEDTYSFDVNINDMNYEFQFYVSEGETNQSIQERLARLINNSGIGLKASVTSMGDRSALQIESESSGISFGRDQIFRITDDRTSKASGTVQYFGLDQLTRAPSNANFLLNGEERSASSNHFTVGKLYDITLNHAGAEGEATTISLKTDTESVAENISGFIRSYNDFLQSVSTFTETQSRSKLLVNELTNLAKHYGGALEEFGIQLEDDGSIQVDQDRLLQAAAQSEDLSGTFHTLKDFSNALLRKSNQIALNPMDYVQRTVVAYKNPGHNFVAPYANSSYSGMMFNFYC
jgi:flagellar hook-associated protein 2